jgi:23S rRNA pseudouridine2605 synthase
LPKHLPRLLSVGRLDANTEGLLLLTNDGGLARVLELPATGWLRRYRVRAHGRVQPDQLAALRNGIVIDGVRYGSIEAKLDREQGANVWLTFAMREGKHREVKNVLGHLGLAVNRLIRVSFGPFQLGELVEGAVEEVKTRTLREQLGERITAAAGADFSAPLVERTETPSPTRHPETPTLTRHPEVRAQRASKGPSRGRSSFEACASAQAPQDDGRKQQRVAQDDGRKPQVAHRKHRRSDPDRIGGPERARLARRGRRPHSGKTR